LVRRCKTKKWRTRALLKMNIIKKKEVFGNKKIKNLEIKCFLSNENDTLDSYLKIKETKFKITF